MTILINDRQEQLFRALKGIKDGWLLTSMSELENDTVDIQEQQNDLITSVIYSVMELIDGYNDDLPFPVDLIDKKTNLSLKGDTELHDNFMNYLYEVEK